GPEPLVQVDVEGPHALQGGDIFLLCSDGLSGQVTDSEMGAIAAGLPAAEACRFLVDLANLRGGPDNITVVIVKLGNDPAAPPPAPPVKKPLWARIPRPFPALLLGVWLAAGAALLTYHKEFFGGVSLLVLGLAALGAGLVGLAVQHAREQRRLENEPEAPPEPRIHRHK